MTVGVPDYSMDTWGIKYVKKLEFNPRTGEARTGGKDRAARDSVSAGIAGLEGAKNPTEGKTPMPAKPRPNSPAALAPKTPEGKKQIESTLNTTSPAHKRPSKSPTSEIDTGKQTRLQPPKFQTSTTSEGKKRGEYKSPQGFKTGKVGSKTVITSETSTGKGHAQAQQRGSPNITENTGEQPKAQQVEVPHRRQQRGGKVVHAPVRDKETNRKTPEGKRQRKLNPLQSTPSETGGRKFHPRGTGGKKVISSEISHGSATNEGNKQVLPKTASDIVILKCKLLKMGLIKAGYRQGTGYGQGGSHESFAGDNPSGTKAPKPKPIKAEVGSWTKRFDARGNRVSEEDYNAGGDKITNPDYGKTHNRAGTGGVPVTGKSD